MISEEVPATPDHWSTALRDEIMSDVEAVLSQKADNLWKRGQEEIGKMQQDRNEVVKSVADLQKRQDQLVEEQRAMNGALLAITTKMEFVAMEMREALRSVGKPDDASGSSGGMLEALASMPALMPPALPLHPLAGFPGLGLDAGMSLGIDVENSEHSLTLQGLPPCTPPRITPLAPVPAEGPCIAPPLPGSPAVRLSLASVLPSVPATTPSSAAPIPGLTRLHIADCLDATIGGASPVSTSCSLQLDGGNSSSSSSTASPPRVVAGGYQGYQDSPWPPAAPGLSKAPGGTLRADAPAFVMPGC